MFFTLFFSACGGGSGSTPTPTPAGSNISITFDNGVFPVALAEQLGTGAWTSTSAPSSNPLTLNVPEGTTSYGLAYVCPTVMGMGPINFEYVVEAAVSDGTSYTVNCPTNPSTGAVTGTVVSSFANTANVAFYGAQGTSTFVPGNSGSLSGQLAVSSGSEDIAAVALDASNNALAIQILRSQTVPGAINAGASGSFLTIGSSGATTTQSITATGLPAGFNSPSTYAGYQTSNGTFFGLGSVSGQYAVVPSSTAQSGDFYLFTAGASSNVINNESQNVYAYQSTPTPGAISLTLPAPLGYSSPAAAALPSFDLAYAGFSGASVVADWAQLNWQTSGIDYQINVTATSAFQNGLTTLTVPDLSSVSGFIAPAASGTSIGWFSGVYGGSYLPFIPTPSTGTLGYVWNEGQYTEP
jgi:hypothetical protein